MIEISQYLLEVILFQSFVFGLFIGIVFGVMLIGFLIFMQRKKVSLFLKNLSEGKRKNKIIEQFDDFKDLAKQLAEETNTGFMQGTYHDILEILKYYQRKFLP